MSEELKPCPFCGGRARVCEVKIYEYVPALKIECEDCHCSTNAFYASKKIELKEAWNRRDVYIASRMKYCPFCSNQPYIEIRTVDGHDYYSGRCSFCSVETSLYPDVDKAIEAWNRRVEI
ncbi:MAG: Lar family restriction alleviation protein [Synergistaceae bacterium]|nr:Lar family restriction alleviation protein [Synergistaceae bacterium]